MFISLKFLRISTFGAIFAVFLGTFAGPQANAALIAEYMFDGNANDSSGNGYNGSLGGDAGFSAGQFGQALELDGSGDFISVALPTQTFSAFTIELWARSDQASPSGAPHLISLNDANNFIVLWNPTSTSIDAYSTGLINTNLTGNISLSIVPGEWFHLAYTWDGLEKTLYKDGELIGSTAATGTLSPIDPGNPNFTIGARYSEIHQFWDGAFDNVRVYDHALSQSELGFYTDNVSSIPTPGNIAILCLGLAGLGFARRRRAA